MIRRPPRSPLFPSTTLFRSHAARDARPHRRPCHRRRHPQQHPWIERLGDQVFRAEAQPLQSVGTHHRIRDLLLCERDRKSTRLNSSHSQISYAVFCLTKKNCPALASAALTYPSHASRFCVDFSASSRITSATVQPTS